MTRPECLSIFYKPIKRRHILQLHTVAVTMASSKTTFFFVALLMSPVSPHDDKTIRCTHDQFQCETVPQCIPSDWKCDGAADCEDRSDERICGSPWWTEGAVGAGGAVLVAATQVAVAVLGFGVAGIGVGTLTAGSMSRPATLGVGLGIVSTLHTIGATGGLNHSHSAGAGGVGVGGEERVIIGPHGQVLVGDGHHNMGEDELQDED